MVNYNMTGFSDSTSVYGMFVALNTLSDNLLSYMVVLGVFLVVLFVLLRSNPPAESFVGASTVLTVFSLMFLLAGLVNIIWVIGSSVVMAAAVVKLYFQ